MELKVVSIKVARLLVLSVLISACSSGDGSSDDGGGGDGGGGDGKNPGTGILPASIEHNTAFKTQHYSGSGQCNVCHNDLDDEEGNDVSLGSDWSTSMMANAARDPYWKAKVAAEVDRNPPLSSELNVTCSKCHAPMAVDALQKENKPVVMLGKNGFLDDHKHEMFDSAMEGVSCTLCHQIEDNGLLGTQDGVSGKFSVIAYSEDDKQHRPAYGQYSDPSGGYMIPISKFTPEFSSHMSKSEVCATCHDLRTPSVDGSGEIIIHNEANFFPEQMVFSEWRNSDFNEGGSKHQNCQDCHMPDAEGAVMLATEGGGIPREDFAQHTFLGGNTVVQSILQKYRTELGIENSSEAFEASIIRNQHFLNTAADIEILSSVREGTLLTASVKVTNNTGHKLPSGYPSRRAYLHFVVTNENGEVVFESGKANDNGSVEGIDEDKDSSKFEPHYDVIDSPDKVQVYEAIMQDSDLNVTHTLMRATDYVKDNRLLPSGFNKLNAPNDIKVAGLAVSDNNFTAASDVVTYQVTLPQTSSYNIFVELVYQPLAYGHLQDLFKSIDLKEVDEFKTMFDGAPVKFESIAAATVHVQ